MAGRRELLARIGRAAAARAANAVQSAVADLGKGTLERIARTLESVAPARTPPAPAPPSRPEGAKPGAERTKPGPASAAKPGPAHARVEAARAEAQEKKEADDLLASLQTLNAATKQIVDRLTALGYRETAEAITRVPEVPNINDRGAVPEAPTAPEVKVKPKKPLKRAEPEATPLPPLEPKAMEPKYRLQGTLIHVPYTKNLRFLYRMLSSEWRRIGIGKKKDGTPQPDGNAYSADAILQAKGGETADAGIRIPLEVLRSEEAFVAWASANGYENGGSVVVDGMIPPPGGAFAGERVWTVDAAKYKHLDTDGKR